MHADFHYALGYSLGNLGENTGAAAAYRRSTELDRNNLDAYLGLGVVLLRQGNYNAALWVNKQMLAVDPNNASAYKLMGAILMQQRRFKEAIAALNRAIDLYKQQGQTEGVQRTEAMLKQLQ